MYLNSIKYLKIVILTGLVCFSRWTTAQTFFGLQNSNYAGVNAIYTNPALVTNMNHQRSANIGGLGVNIDNNYVSLETPFSFWALVNNDVDDKYKDQNGRIKWDKNWIKEDPSVSNIRLNIGTEYRGPSYVNTYGRIIWGTASRTRSSMRINNLSTSVVDWAKQFLDSSTTPSIIAISSPTLNISANSYQEVSGIFGIQLIEKSTMRLGVGTSIKGILATGSFNIQNTGATFRTIGMDTLELTGGFMKFSYTDNNLLRQIFQGVVAGSMPNLLNINGLGMGFDLGFVLELGENMSTEERKGNYKDYKLKIAASILDLGKMTYRNQSKGFILDGTKPVKMALNSPDFLIASAEGAEEVFDYTVDYLRNQGALKDISEKTQVELPTTLQLQVDYQILPYFNVAAHLQQAININDVANLHFNSAAVIVPRVEHNWFEVSMPISIYNNYRQFGLGAYFRAGPVYFGTDNFLYSLSATKYSGMNVYFGISTLIR
jgi:hypothetical protein